MKEPEDNHRDRRLDDLLRRAREGRLEDDFERDAAEGFSNMSDEEAFAAKASLDRKAKQLLGPKIVPRMSWSLAAGLALVIGLTVFFLREDLFPRDNLALGHTRLEAEIGPDPHYPAPPSPASPNLITDSQFHTDSTTIRSFSASEKDHAPQQRFATNRKEATLSPTPAPLTAAVAKNQPEEDVAALSYESAEPAAEAEEKATANKADLAFNDAGAAVPVTLSKAKSAAGGAPESGSGGNKKKMSEQTRAQAAPQIAASSDSGPNAPDSVSWFILDHLKKNLPGEFRQPFVVHLKVHENGHISDAEVRENDFSSKQIKELVNWLNRCEVKNISAKKLIKEYRWINFKYAP